MEGYGQPMVQLSHQACLSCKKQKRKCDKGLPSCSLCLRMNRPCDYSNPPQTPSNDDFLSMQRQIAELTARLDAQTRGMSGLENVPGGGMSPSASYAPPASALSAQDTGLNGYTYTPQQHQEYAIQPVDVPNRFPRISFLDSDKFKHGG